MIYYCQWNLEKILDNRVYTRKLWEAQTNLYTGYL